MTTVIAEKNREQLMAFCDGELPDTERKTFESFLKQSPELQTELHRQQRLSRLLQASSPYPSPKSDIWSSYYRGVCRKMETRASWAYWGAAALTSAVAGSLLIFSFPQSMLAVGVGTLCLLGGCGLLWMSYYCNCGK
jgi:anti-sigma factor RsiW